MFTPCPGRYSLVTGSMGVRGFVILAVLLTLQPVLCPYRASLERVERIAPNIVSDLYLSK